MPHSPLAALLLLLLLSVCQLCHAGNYDAYIRAQEDKNQQLLSRYLKELSPGGANRLEELRSRALELQARHYVRDAEYPRQFDPDSYWSEMLDSGRPADREAADEAAGDDLLQTPVSDRREEEPFLNKIWGGQRVSGGAGEQGQVTGPHNQPQAAKVKTDSLPSYCDPPNPCPLRADPRKLVAPCSREVQDTAEFNYADTLRKLADGHCPCDTEHMRCPDLPHAATKKVPSGSANPYLRGNKRDKLDAKKSPALAVAKRGVKANFRSRVVEKKNPWLDDTEALDTVEKKAGRQGYDVEEPLVDAR